MKIFLLFFCFLGFSVSSEATPVADQWAAVSQPTLDREAKSIGTYTAGCLQGGASLPIDGKGYQVMRLSRKRNFGHPDLIRFIENIGKKTDSENWGRILVGDLGQPRGGPTPSGHSSHQTGRDVDIWFLLAKTATARLLTLQERETWSAPSVLKKNSDVIDSRNWSTTNELILKTAASAPEVGRIFVNPSIKRLLCERYAEQDWLGKIRPWWGHDDHFHVRLNCPENNPLCIKQEPVPPGTGCDASLDWWFSAEARLPKARPKKAPGGPVLPEKCKALLSEP